MSGYINLESVGTQIDIKSTNITHSASNIIHKQHQPPKLEKEQKSANKVINKSEVIKEKKLSQTDQNEKKQKNETFRKNNLGKAVTNINTVFNLFGIKREFSIHQKSKRIIIKIMDNETGDIIREIPPEKFWDNYSKMQETIGLAVDMKG